MEQLAVMKKTKKPALLQDFVLDAKREAIKTHASHAECQVCSKGIEDGYSITAKPTFSGNILLCEKHYMKS